MKKNRERAKHIRKITFLTEKLLKCKVHEVQKGVQKSKNLVDQRILNQIIRLRNDNMTILDLLFRSSLSKSYDNIS